MSTASLALCGEARFSRAVERKALVVIGGGITGLSTAITWAMHRDVRAYPVLVLEKEASVGGCAALFTHGGHIFDTVQMIPDVCGVLGFLGVGVELERFGGDCARILLADPLSGMSEAIRIPFGYDLFHDALRERYPREAARIGRFLSETRALYDASRGLPGEPGFFHRLLHLKTAQNRARTFRKYCDRFGFADPELREVFDALASFGALPAEWSPAVMAISALYSVLEGGYRPKGGFGQLPRAMRTRLVELGGEVRTRTPVERILVDRRTVRGVRLGDGTIIATDAVIAASDPMTILWDRDGKIGSAQSPIPAITVSLGLDDGVDLAGRGVNPGYTVLTTGGETFAGRKTSRFHLVVTCPSLVAGGNPTVVIRAVPAPESDERDFNADGESHDRGVDFVIGLVEKYMIPGLRDHIRVCAASVHDLHAYSDAAGSGGFRICTPVRGLCQPKRGHGIRPALLGGIYAVDTMLRGEVTRGAGWRKHIR